MNKCIIILAVLFMAGCATAPAAPTALLPIPTPPKLPERTYTPALPVDQITVDSSPQEVVQAYPASVLILKTRVKELETIIWH